MEIRSDISDTDITITVVIQCKGYRVRYLGNTSAAVRFRYINICKYIRKDYELGLRQF